MGNSHGLRHVGSLQLCRITEPLGLEGICEDPTGESNPPAQVWSPRAGDKNGSGGFGMSPKRERLHKLPGQAVWCSTTST